MPIRVHCPSGCLIRMPTNRAGKVVRCPECKSTLQLRLISESEQRSGKPIPIYATIVEVAPTMEEGAEVNQDVVSAEPFVADDDSKIVAAVEQAIDSLDSGPPAIPPESARCPRAPGVSLSNVR